MKKRNQFITKFIKKWVAKNNFPYGWEDGFLSSSLALAEYQDTKEDQELLIENYLLWGQWEDWKNEI